MEQEIRNILPINWYTPTDFVSSTASLLYRSRQDERGKTLTTKQADESAGGRTIQEIAEQTKLAPKGLTA